MDNRRFDWNLIKSFLAVLDAGTLSGAARQSAISQPTLGRHIDELEELTGLILFERGRAGMQPTAAALQLGGDSSSGRPAIAGSQWTWRSLQFLDLTAFVHVIAPLCGAGQTHALRAWLISCSGLQSLGADSFLRIDL